ncbi:hypothetical protein ACQR3P_28945 [Rhodococcus sp. IEGM1300]
MIEPGKQHNFRILSDATWTEDFNRILAVSGLSANKLINHMIQTGLATLDITGEKQRLAFVTTNELEYLVEKRLAGEKLVTKKNSPPSKASASEEEQEEDSQKEPVVETPSVPPRKPAINSKRKPRTTVSIPDSVKSSVDQFKVD